jgi:two-component system chemotaxis family response regulator WspR
VICERLRTSIEALQISHGASSTSPWVTISVGAAICRPTHEMMPSDLSEAADLQLYTAKRQGRNQVSLTQL